MKIGSTDPIRVGTAKAKKSEVKGSGFHELLHTRLDDIQPEARQDNSGDAAERSGNTLEIMEDAALMLDKALELGADGAINAGRFDAVSEVAKVTNGGADAVVICVRDGKVLNQAVEMCGTGATISVGGVIPPTEITMNRWIAKRLKLVTVLGGPGGPDTLALAMYLMSHKQIDPSPLISEIMPLDDIQRAIDTRYSGENIEVLLKP